MTKYNEVSVAQEVEWCSGKSADLGSNSPLPADSPKIFIFVNFMFH